jgi:predicted CopG family antitoxin
MSSTEWTSIPVHPDVRDDVRTAKPDEMSYSEFIRELVDERGDDAGRKGHSDGSRV